MIEKEFLNGKEKAALETKGYICIPEADLPPMEDDFMANFSKRISRIMGEFVEGFQFVRGLKNAVSFFGSSRAGEDTRHYEEARKLAYSLAKQGRPIVTGGGPGIMEAANRGAYEAQGESIGINIKLPKWQWANKYVTSSIALRYFFTRKVMFSFAAKVYVFFPGGYGTLDEFFEMVTLVQTNKLVRKVLIIAVGNDYWGPLFSWIEKDVYGSFKAIKKEELKIVRIVDSAEEALAEINKFAAKND